MASTDSTDRLFNARIIGRNRTIRRTMVAGSQHEAERRLRELGRVIFHGGTGGVRRIEAIEAHGPINQRIEL